MTASVPVCLVRLLMVPKKSNAGRKQAMVVDNIMKCRDSSRLIERFFLGIKKGDTPENSQFSKLALEWVDEFLLLIERPV